MICQQYAPKHNTPPVVSCQQNTVLQGLYLCFFFSFSYMAALQRELPSHPLVSEHHLDTSLTSSFISLSLFPLDYAHSQLCQIKVLSRRMLWTSLMSLADTIRHSLGSSSVMHEWMNGRWKRKKEKPTHTLPLYISTPVYLHLNMWCPCIVFQIRPHYRPQKGQRGSSLQGRWVAMGRWCFWWALPTSVVLVHLFSVHQHNPTDHSKTAS